MYSPCLKFVAGFLLLVSAVGATPRLVNCAYARIRTTFRFPAGTRRALKTASPHSWHTIWTLG